MNSSRKLPFSSKHRQQQQQNFRLFFCFAKRIEFRIDNHCRKKTTTTTTDDCIRLLLLLMSILMMMMIEIAIESVHLMSKSFYFRSALHFDDDDRDTNFRFHFEKICENQNNKKTILQYGFYGPTDIQTPNPKNYVN